LTADAKHVLEELTRVDGLPAMAVAGYSLGGNLALKLAGEYANDPPPQLRAVAAVSPILEISGCVRALERRGNFLYQWNFVRDLTLRARDALSRAASNLAICYRLMCRRAEPVDQDAGELRALSFFLVLEVDEHVLAARRRAPDVVGPRRNVRRCVPFVAQAE